MIEDIQKYRARKNKHFKGPHSPLDDAKKQGFEGLTYYDFKEDYVIRVQPQHDEQIQILELQTNTTELREYQRWGYVTVHLPEGSHQLELYIPVEEDDPQRVFVPFKDATNGKTTYSGGRYIDGVIDGEEVILDFNMAYNPLCAYSEGWVCPLPPAANWIPFEVEAGEQDLT